MLSPVSKYGCRSTARWIEGAVFIAILVATISLTFAGTQRLLRHNGKATTLEPAHATAPPSAKADFFFTHTAPPVIEDDEPNLKISVPVRNTTGAEVHFENVSRSCSCADAELKSRALAAGERTSLEVTIRTRGKSGLQKVHVDLADSAGRQL